tara:strand:+ start:1428 stop:1730 length:303 start_codon:yes stop_codon:yes gene_type:complete
MKNLINKIYIFYKKLLKINKKNLLKAKNIMINAKEFDINNLKLGNTYKVHEDILVKDFINKILKEKLTIIVVNNKGEMLGFINEEQINIIEDYDKVRITK